MESRIDLIQLPTQYFFGIIYQVSRQEQFYIGLETVCHTLKLYLEQFLLPLFLSNQNPSFSHLSSETLVQFLHDQPLTIKYYQRSPTKDSVVGYHIPKDWFQLLAQYLSSNDAKEFSNLYLCVEPNCTMCKYRFQGFYHLLDKAWKSIDAWAKKQHYTLYSQQQHQQHDSESFERNEEIVFDEEGWEMESWNCSLGYEKFITWEGNSSDANPRNFITEIYRPLLSS